MGIVSNALLLEKGLRADFMKAFSKAEDPADVMPMIMQTNSTADSEKYGWLGQVAQMTEWVDERILRGLKDYDYSIPNLDYESTIAVKRNTLEDDQLGAVKIRINDLAKVAKAFPRKLFFDALIAGGTDLGYDGVAFFSGSHPESGTNQDNDLATAYSGSLPTLSELKIAFIAAEAALMGFKNDQNELINDMGGDMELYFVCGPAIKETARELFNAGLISNTTNTLKGAAKLVASGRLSGATFYLMNSAGAVKPLVFQKRQDIKFGSLEGNSERGFMRKEFLYGVDARYGFGYGLWHKAVKMAKT